MFRNDHCNSVETFVPPKKQNKRKSILIDQDIPSRVKSKEELAYEKISENVAAHLQAKEDAAVTKEQLDLKASEALAQKIQDDLDKMGPQYTTILPAERKKELDEIAKNLTAEQWENLAEQAASKPNLGKSELGVDNPDFAQLMVERGRLLRQQEAEIKAKHQKERPWTKNEIKKYMRNFVKNQGCSMFGSGWTQKRVWGFSDQQLTYYYDKIISNHHSSGIMVQDVLEFRGRLLAEPHAKKAKIHDSAAQPAESIGSFHGGQENVQIPSVLSQKVDTPDAPMDEIPTSFQIQLA